MHIVLLHYYTHHLLFNVLIHPFRKKMKLFGFPRNRRYIAWLFRYTKFLLPQVTLHYGLCWYIADSHDCHHLCYREWSVFPDQGFPTTWLLPPCKMLMGDQIWSIVHLWWLIHTASKCIGHRNRTTVRSSSVQSLSGSAICLTSLLPAARLNDGMLQPVTYPSSPAQSLW